MIRWIGGVQFQRLTDPRGFKTWRTFDGKFQISTPLRPDQFSLEDVSGEYPNELATAPTMSELAGDVYRIIREPEVSDGLRTIARAIDQHLDRIRELFLRIPGAETETGRAFEKALSTVGVPQFINAEEVLDATIRIKENHHADHDAHADESPAGSIPEPAAGVLSALPAARIHPDHGR